jgi:hypothetical protein
VDAAKQRGQWSESAVAYKPINIVKFMKKLMLILLVAVAAMGLAIRAHRRRAPLLRQNARMEQAVRSLKLRIEKAEQSRQTVEERESKLAEELRLQDAAYAAQPKPATATKAPAIAPPDPDHQGGWPANADYFYLPKSQLTNANFQLLAGGHLTEEAAKLFGMSPAEKAAADHAFSDLLAQFRSLEAAKMKTIDTPEEWGGPRAMFDSALVYQIPSLADDANSVRQNLASQLQQIVGPNRADTLQPVIDAHFRDQLDDLGSGERTVAFLWKPENDGSHSVWYGIRDDRHGAGSFQRVPDKVDPDSQIAYYAGLFGVPLP